MRGVKEFAACEADTLEGASDASAPVQLRKRKSAEVAARSDGVGCQTVSRTARARVHAAGVWLVPGAMS